MLAKVNGLFRLTRNAELMYSGSGTAILKLGLACSEKYGDKESQLFLDATVFGKIAEIINTYAGEKGTQIYLSGKLQTDTWEKEGVKQYKTVMIVEGFDFVSKPKGEVPVSHQNANGNETAKSTYKHTDYQQKAQERQPMPRNTLPEIDINEDEIPF